MIRDFLAWLPLSSLLFLLSLLPERMVASLLRLIIKKTGKKRAMIAKSNISHAFPHMNEDEIDALVKKNMDHFLIPNFNDMIFVQKRLRWAKNHISVMGQNIAEARSSEKDEIIVTMHFGHFHLFPMALWHQGIKMHTIKTRHKNRYAGQWAQKLYQDYALSTMEEAGHSNMRKILQASQKREPICFFIDQYMPQGHAVEINFFSRPTNVASLPFRLAVKDKRPILPIISRMGKDTHGNPAIHLQHAPLLRANPKAKDPIDDLAKRSYAIFEEWIRQQPELWIWAHQFWRQ